MRCDPAVCSGQYSKFHFSLRECVQIAEQIALFIRTLAVALQYEEVKAAAAAAVSERVENDVGNKLKSLFSVNSEEARDEKRQLKFEDEIGNFVTQENHSKASEFSAK